MLSLRPVQSTILRSAVVSSRELPSFLGRVSWTFSRQLHNLHHRDVAARTVVKRRYISMASNEDLKAAKLFDVSHVTAVVTGGGTGIGLMIAQGLVANGAKVYITGRREDALQTVAEKYNTGPGKILPLSGDVSKKEEALRLAKELESKEPKGIHLLVNNAGIARDQATSYSANGQPEMTDAKAISEHFLKSTSESWLETFNTNVVGQYFMAMAFLPLLAKARENTPSYASSIINVSSISGFMKGPSGGQFAYASSKAAFTHLTRMLATVFAGAKVRVNCIAPGIFPSEMTTGQSDENQKSEFNRQLSNPAGRAGNDADMAATALFLAGPGGLFYNSAVLIPDGGHTLVSPACI